MATIQGFRFSKIVVLESLEAHEAKTGKANAEHLRGLLENAGLSIQVDLIEVESASALRTEISRLATESTATGQIPIIHIECHGHMDHGLELANGSCLSWDELSGLFVKLNQATGFNLLAVLSACYGGHFLSRLFSFEPAPFWAMLAPTETVDPAEILRGFRRFYAELFAKRDVGIAIHSLDSEALERGHWFAQNAEEWFERMTSEYVKNCCNARVARLRVQANHAKLQTEGLSISMKEVKRHLKAANNSALLGGHFEKYFMVETIPKNAIRFQPTRQRLLRHLSAMRSTGRYWL